MRVRTICIGIGNLTVNKADMVPLKDAHRAHIPAESDHQAILIQYSDSCGRREMPGMEIYIQLSNIFGGDKRKREFMEAFVEKLTFKL